MRSTLAGLVTCALVGLGATAVADDPPAPKPKPKPASRPAKPARPKPAKKPAPGGNPFPFPFGNGGANGQKTEAELIADLASKDPNVRAKAAEALGQRNVSEAVPKLIERFHDEALEVRLAAIQAMAGIANSDAALPKLVALLADPVEKVRLAAGYVLQQKGPKKTLALLGKALGSKDRNTRYMTVLVLRRFGPEAKAAAPGVQLLLRDPDEEVRVEAARTLGAMRTQEAAKALIDGLTHPKDAKLRTVAALELRWFKDQGAPAVPALRKLLADADWRAAQAATRALAGIGPKAQAAIPDLIGLLKHRIYNLRAGAVVALAGIGKAAVPALTQALASEVRKVRLGAAEALGRIGPDAHGAVAGLVRLLKDDNGRVRRAAVEALGRMGSKARAAAEALRDLQESDDDRRVRRAARLALKRIAFGR